MACYLNHPVSRLRYDLGYIYMEYHTHYLEEILTNVHGVVYVHMLCLHRLQLHTGTLATHISGVRYPLFGGSLNRDTKFGVYAIYLNYTILNSVFDIGTIYGVMYGQVGGSTLYGSKCGLNVSYFNTNISNQHWNIGFTRVEYNIQDSEEVLVTVYVVVLILFACIILHRNTPGILASLMWS